MSLHGAKISNCLTLRNRLDKWKHRPVPDRSRGSEGRLEFEIRPWQTIQGLQR